jgi:hypothetical protein
MRSPKKPEGRGGPLADELSEAIEEQLTELVTDLRGTADRQFSESMLRWSQHRQALRT